jgi:hypothetical protein
MDSWQGDGSSPITLNKYIYAGSDPVQYVDYSGNSFTLAGQNTSNTIVGILATSAIVSYQIGQSVATGGNEKGGFTSTQTGWILLAAMSSSGAKLRGLINDKLNERDDSNEVITLHRVVGNTELASLYTLNEFALGPNAFPKQFFHTAAESIAYGYKTKSNSILKASTFHLVNATISKRLYNNLFHGVFEPGIGPIVTVQDGMLPAFNFDMRRYGGWNYKGTYD